MENLKNDVKYALRILMKNSGMTAAAILTLALGIGINTTIFSLVHAILLRPLPYPDSEAIQSVYTSRPQKERDNFSPANFLDLREQSKSFQAISAYGIWGYDVSGANEPESLTACRATHGFFEVLGVNPLYGRTFLPEEELPGRERVAILANSLWKRRYAGDPKIVGQTLLLDGLPYMVVGVMPEGFAEPSFVEMWTPLSLSPEQKQQRGASRLEIVGRLKRGVPPAQAQAELNTIAASLAKQYPQYNEGMAIRIMSAAEALTGPIKPTLLILWGAVLFVLLVACANLANLMFASAISREREFAMRLALGASSARLRKQLLTECLVLALAGGAMGILLSVWGIPAVIALSPEDIPRLEEVKMNATVLLFSILLSAVSGILFGLVPALRISRHKLSQFMKEGAQSSGTGPEKARYRNLLIGAQVAVVLVLLVGAGLMMRSFGRLRSVHPGFNPERLLILQVFLPHARYEGPDARRAFSAQLMENVRALPEIQSAAVASPAPFDSVPHFIETGFRLEGQPPLRPGEEPVASYNRVTEDFFSTLQIPIRKGRAFQAGDHENALRVAIVNEALERRFWPEKGAIGQRIVLGTTKPITLEIVGVAGSVKQLSLSAADSLQIYVPFRQSPSGALSLIVRTRGDPANVIADLKGRLWAVDPALPAQYLSTVRNLVSLSLMRPRANTVLLSIFAGMAFLLAMIGLYGVVSYSVSQRTREIGVRVSLGAQKGVILRMILIQGVRITLYGIAAGTAGAFVLTRFISSLLFEVSSRDPVIFCAGAFVMTAVSLIACYIPARRAMKVDPVVALRCE